MYYKSLDTLVTQVESTCCGFAKFYFLLYNALIFIFISVFSFWCSFISTAWVIIRCMFVLFKNNNNLANFQHRWNSLNRCLYVQEMNTLDVDLSSVLAEWDSFTFDVPSVENSELWFTHSWASSSETPQHRHVRTVLISCCCSSSVVCVVCCSLWFCVVDWGSAAGAQGQFSPRCYCS